MNDEKKSQDFFRTDFRKDRKFSGKSRTRLLVILFTDAVGSTGIKQGIGDIRAKRLEDLHREILLHVLDDFQNGRVVRSEGDSYIFAFVRPADAVLFALRAQAMHRDVRAGNIPGILFQRMRPDDAFEDVKPDLPILPGFRVGIHMGTIIEESGLKGPVEEDGIGDIKGIQADTAARIMGMAEGGQILCSYPVYDDAKHALKGLKSTHGFEIEWRAHGAYILKGREKPLDIFEVGEKGVAVFSKPEGTPKARPVVSGDGLLQTLVKGDHFEGEALGDYLKRRGASISFPQKLELAKQITNCFVRVNETGFAFRELDLSMFQIRDLPDASPIVKLSSIDVLVGHEKKRPAIQELGMILCHVFTGAVDDVAAPDASTITDPIISGIIASCLTSDSKENVTPKQVLEAFTDYRNRKIQLRKTIRMATALTVIAVFFFLWVRVFDFFSMDTRMESGIMAIGNLFVQTDLPPFIAIVGIDDERMDKTWRGKHAELVEKLSRAGAAVIVFDMFFESHSPFDDRFSQAIIEAKNMGTSVVVGVRRLDDGEPVLVDKIKRAANGYGILCIGERLGFGCLAPLLVTRNGEVNTRSLSFEAARCFWEVISNKRGDRAMSVIHDEDLIQGKIPVTEILEMEQPVKSCPAIGPKSSMYNIFIHLSPEKILRDKTTRFRYTDVMERFDPEMLKTRFSGKMVFVGVVNPKDRFDVSGPLGTRERYGVELHADAANTILFGEFAHPISWEWEFLIIGFFGLTGAFLGYYRRWPLCYTRRICLVVVFFFCLFLSVASFLKFRVLLNPVYYFTAFFVTSRVVERVARDGRFVSIFR